MGSIVIETEVGMEVTPTDPEDDFYGQVGTIVPAEDWAEELLSEYVAYFPEKSEALREYLEAEGLEYEERDLHTGLYLEGELRFLSDD